MIETRIEQLYRESGCAMVVPEQFIDDGLGSDEEVLRALKELEKEGDLRGYARLRCVEGHDFFGGTLDEVAWNPYRQCTFADCPTAELSDEERQDEANQPRVIVLYVLSRRWRANLDQESQKKSPALPQ